MRIKKVNIPRLLDELGLDIFSHPENVEDILARLESTDSAEWQPEHQLRWRRLRAFWNNLNHRLEAAQQDYEAALMLAEEATKPDVAIEVAIMADVAGLFINQRNWEAAENAVIHAENLLPRCSSCELLRARVACRRGYLSLHFGQYERATEAFFQAEILLQDNGQKLGLEDAYFLGLTHTGLGDLWEKVNEAQKSSEAFLKALDTYETYALRTHLIWHYLNAGRSFLVLESYDKAVFYFKKAAEQPAEGRAMHRAKGSACANLGMVSIMQGNLSSATEWLNQAAILFGEPEEKEDFSNLSKVELQRARIFLQIGEQKYAEKHLDHAEQLAKRGDSLQLLVNVLHLKADFYAEQRRFEEAFHYRTRAAEWGLKTAEQLREEQIREMHIKYDAVRREQEAKVAKLELTGLHLKALRVQMNPHFIFNSLNAIQGYIHSNREADAATWLARFAKLIRMALELSYLEQVALSQEVHFLEQYLELNKSLRFRDAFTYSVRIDEKLKKNACEIPAMVVQPFVENAIEHGMRPKKGGHLDVFFEYRDKNHLCVTITDNGVGLYAKPLSASPEKHQSRGVQITKERLGLLFQGKNVKAPFVSISDRSEMTGGIEKGVISEVLLPIL